MAVFCVAADSPDAAKKDQEKLQGEWTLASGQREGQDFPEELVKSLKRTMKDDTFTITRDGEALAKGKFKLDPTKKPKAIDISLDTSDMSVKGIYELEGDTFKLCYAAPGEDRPKEFVSKADSGITLAVWKRVKK
jgi:uncharacterized protein (TIGR03067 family)